jgi:asparagine synthase (glutamine-hydrolysing)
MCGFFGVVYRDTTRLPGEAQLQETARSLRHRGPDACGTFVAEGVGLVHTRLSLVDLSERGNQPFWDAAGRYALLYNGEVYNFRELRKELEAEGREFRSTTDTEVILEGLLAWGADRLLPRLNGMFSFCLWDRVSRSAVLARDRFGTKPLFLYEGDQFVAFASELKALRPWIAFEADPFTVVSYLSGFGGPMQGQTFLRDIRAVGGGRAVEVAGGRVSSERSFFALPDFWDADRVRELDRLTPVDIVDRLDEAINLSVERQLFADAKVGAFCSGGVDSSLLMAVAARKHDNLAIFHANVKGRWSEVGAARRLAEHLRLDLKIVDVEEQEFIDLLPDVMAHYEQPCTYHPNCAPFLMVSRLARQHGVKGLLSGEGSDECFLGYPWLGRERITNAFYAGGRRIRHVVRALPQMGRLMWPWDEGRSETITALCNRFELDLDTTAVRRAAAALPMRVPEGNVRSVEYLGYHLRTLLHRNDTMGMAASIESRFPFLDLDVVSLAVNMPYRYKIRYSPTVWEKAHPFVRDKWVVRAVADRYIPRALSQRIKIGFWTTAFERMRVAASYFDDSFPRELFALSRPQLNLLLARADHELVGRLLHLDVWARVCLRNEPADALLPRLRGHVRILPD